MQSRSREALQMRRRPATTTTQVLVPLNSSNTLHNHIHVAVRLKPFLEQENATSKQRGYWEVKGETALQGRQGKETF